MRCVFCSFEFDEESSQRSLYRKLNIWSSDTTGGARGGVGTPSRGNSEAMRRTPLQILKDFLRTRETNKEFVTGRTGALRSAIGAEAPLDKFRGAKRQGNLCSGCFRLGNCSMVKCPRCGYETPPEPGWLRRIKKRSKKGAVK